MSNYYFTFDDQLLLLQREQDSYSKSLYIE